MRLAYDGNSISYYSVHNQIHYVDKQLSFLRFINGI